MVALNADTRHDAMAVQHLRLVFAAALRGDGSVVGAELLGA